LSKWPDKANIAQIVTCIWRRRRKRRGRGGEGGGGGEEGGRRRVTGMPLPLLPAAAAAAAAAVALGLLPLVLRASSAESRVFFYIIYESFTRLIRQFG
jgi:hypothetical protein